MIDFGLLLSAIVAVGTPALVAHRWVPAGPNATVETRSVGRPFVETSFIDVVLAPLLLGLAVARVSALALDDPSSLLRLGDVLIIRSGVEFWPGVVAAAALLSLQARRSGHSALVRLAALAPLAMVGAAGYEATCVVRNGCFGPVSSVGLRPDGVTTTMLPIGWLVALAMVGGAVALQHTAKSLEPLVVIALAALVVAGTRAIGSLWLPHLGRGPTRPHVTSIVVAVLAACCAFIAARPGGRQTSRSA